MRRTLIALCATIAGTAPAERAAGIDFKAVVQEYQALKGDPEIVDYLGKDLRAAQRIDKLERILQQSAEVVRESNEQAHEARRRRTAATLGLISGDPAMGDVGRSIRDSTPSPEALEAQAAKAKEAGRDAMIELVASYREIKAALAEQKAAEAEKRAASAKKAKKKGQSE